MFKGRRPSASLGLPDFKAWCRSARLLGPQQELEIAVAAVARVRDWLEAMGWTVQATTESPITGGDGNVEFLLWAKKPG